jgi:hypothetical protein
VYIFNFIEKIAPDDIHYNAQKSSVILTMVKDQSQIMLKNQQPQEPFNNGMSPAKTSSEDNGVEQTTAMTTHEISTADDTEQPSFVDDVMHVCKVIMRNKFFFYFRSKLIFKYELKTVYIESKNFNKSLSE